MLTYLNDHIKPKLILEIGGGTGGSAWAWRHLENNPEIITVTLPEGPLWDDRYSLPYWHQVIFGDSTHPAIVGTVRRELAGHEPDMVFIDGSHLLSDVRFDWQNYALGTPNNGFVVMHDINEFPNHFELEAHMLWTLIKEQYVTREIIHTPGADNGTGLIWL